MNPKHYQGADCRRKHGGLRYRSNDSCVECAKHDSTEWETKNPEQRQKTRAVRFARVYAEPTHWAKMLLWRTARRCRLENIPFNIDATDCVVPEKCPVLGLELKVGGGRNCPTSPSLDKIIPALGYVKGNVRVISWRANELKGNATLAEVEAVLRYMKGEL